MVSTPKMPSKSLASRVAAVLSATCWSRVMSVAAGTRSVEHGVSSEICQDAVDQALAARPCDAVGRGRRGGVERAAVPTRTGSGTDQCRAGRRRPSSSWARSQTVITKSPAAATSSRSRGGRAGERQPVPLRRRRSRRGRCASAGWVPAEAAGIVLARRHSAAASWERAEFAVQTNSTRARTPSTAGSAASAGRRAPGAGRCGAGRPPTAAARSVRQPASTRRWWASRFDGIPSIAASSDGEASPTASVSTIRSRAGSDRAPRAPRPAARPSRHIRLSVHCLNLD